MVAMADPCKWRREINGVEESLVSLRRRAWRGCAESAAACFGRSSHRPRLLLARAVPARRQPPVATTPASRHSARRPRVSFSSSLLSQCSRFSLYSTLLHVVPPVALISSMDGASLHPHLPDWDDLVARSRALKDAFVETNQIHAQNREDPQLPTRGSHDALYIILPLVIVLSTFLFLLLLFLLCVRLLRRRRGIALRDHDGPVDMSREDLIDGEGGLDGVESRWLESVSEPVRRTYLRAKGASPPPKFPLYFSLT